MLSQKLRLLRRTLQNRADADGVVVVSLPKLSKIMSWPLADLVGDLEDLDARGLIAFDTRHGRSHIELLEEAAV